VEPDRELSVRIEEIEKDVDYLKTSHKQTRENQDRMFEIQGESLRKINQIHTCLAGTDYDKDQTNGSGGGLVRRVGRLEKVTTALERWKTQSKTRNTVVWTAVSVALSALWGLLLAFKDRIFS